jgi:hypothetical protein
MEAFLLGAGRGVRTTPKALLIELDDEGQAVTHESPIWVPLSQIHDDSEVYGKGDDGSVIVTRWWAVKQGWAEE